MNTTPGTARLLTAALALVMALTVGACGSSNDSADTNSTTTGTVADSRGLLGSFADYAQSTGFEATAAETECMSTFLATFDDATLIEELTATLDTPPGTIYDAAQVQCPPPASAPAPAVAP